MQKGLGRGLGSLIPKKVTKVTTTPTGDAVVNILTDDDKKKLLDIDPKQIKTNSMQPRTKFNQQALDELADSIKLHGIIQPLVVTKKDGQYELIAGERRLRASIQIGLKTVPVVTRDVASQEKLELALVENIQREQLNPVETALAYRKLLDEFNLTQDKLAARVGKSRPAVTNSLRLLNLPEEIQDALSKGIIAEGHGQIIAGLDTLGKQMKLYRRITGSKMSVGDAWQETKKMGGTKDSRIKINHADRDVEYKFREFFGTKTKIERNSKGGGKIIIEFYGDEDLGEMVGKIK